MKRRDDREIVLRMWMLVFYCVCLASKTIIIFFFFAFQFGVDTTLYDLVL